MGAPTLAGLAAAISIAMRRIEVRELSFRRFNGDQRPVTVLRPAVTENAGGHRMSGATPEKPGKRTEQSAPRPEYGRGTGVPNPIDVAVGGRIRTRRLLLGMNQQALADALDLTFQQVQRPPSLTASAFPFEPQAPPLFRKRDRQVEISFRRPISRSQR
jgi:hypothetical protein